MRLIRKAIKSLIPATLRERYRSRKRQRLLWRQFQYDCQRFVAHSAAVEGIANREASRSYLLKAYHSIEKGMALPNPRPAFGKEKVRLLFQALNRHLNTYGIDPELLQAIAALEAYFEFSRRHGQDLPDLDKEHKSLLNEVQQRGSHPSNGGVVSVSREIIHSVARRDLEEFFASRHSIRQFSGESVDEAQITAAIRMARTTPSVCNRQASRVHVFNRGAGALKVLSHQQGNRGFGDTADRILVVTSTLGCFHESRERNQCWIDGGLFAMSLILALHSQGIGTCCLNWCVSPETDASMREECSIPSDENVIMCMAIGHLRDSFDVARSARRSVESIVTFHDEPA